MPERNNGERRQLVRDIGDLHRAGAITEKDHDSLLAIIFSPVYYLIIAPIRLMMDIIFKRGGS